MIFIIFACPASDRWFLEGDRRISSDILAHVLISIPTGHGIQYPQPRQKLPNSCFLSIVGRYDGVHQKISARISSVITGGLST